MKHVHVTLEDKDHKKILKIKGETTWEEFIKIGAKLFENEIK